jgi:acyl carrier protein
MTLRNELFSDLTEFLRGKCAVDPAAVSEQTRIFDELGLDSLDVIAAAHVFQNRYDISLDNESIASVRTIGDVLTFVEKSIADSRREAREGSR